MMQDNIKKREAIQTGVNINIKMMTFAAERGWWRDVENAIRIIDTLLSYYERSIGAVKIETK